MEYGTDSECQSEVPCGVVMKYEWKSQIFTGTARDFWIYVPAQYDGRIPAGIMVFQDGHIYVDEDGPFRVPIVFDNLIHKRTISLLIGLFINPGHRGETPPDTPWQADNRSYEYDSLSDEYVQFLIEEIIPEVSKKYNLADDPK